MFQKTTSRTPSSPSPKHSKADTASKAAYERKKEQIKARQQAQVRASNDILPFPAVVNPTIVEACRTDFELFCKTFLPLWFPLPFSRDHRKAIQKMQTSVLESRLFAWAMPRGSGKSALCKALAIWALVYGHRRYIVIIGPDAGHANQMLRDIKMTFAGNQRLLEGFPNVCHPIRLLENKAIKANGQHAGGKPTSITWTEGKLVLPTVEGSKASGGIVAVTGITGQIRGMSEATSDGSLLRPDFVIVDDFQTHESAYSPSQCATRLAIIMADVIELAGPGVELCGIIPCTVIRKGDAADQLLDRKLHPEFRGERMKAMYAAPTNDAWWGRYAEVLRSGLEEEESLARANAFYSAEREIADAGADVAWPERFKPTEVSAIQSLMNVKILKPEVFAAEMQNEPLEVNLEGLIDLTPERVVERLSRIPRLTVPATATRLTSFIDVQKTLLYYVVCAFDEDFTGYVVDYGTWPDVKRSYFRLSQVEADSLARATGKANLEEQLYAGMDTLTRLLHGRAWQREGGQAEKHIDFGMIDGNWPEAENVVYTYCRQSQFAANIMPSRSRFYGPTRKPISQTEKKVDERRGLEWFIPNVTKHGKSHVVWDSGFWKSHTLARLTTEMGNRGCLTLFGDDKRPHRMFADQLCAENRIVSETAERTVYLWEQRPGADNHWWDCLVGCAVAASVMGVSLEKVHVSTKPPVPPTPKTFAQMKEEARARRGA
jgi:hypothetical protein